MDQRRIPALLFSISIFLLVVGGLFYVHYRMQPQPMVAEAGVIPASPIPNGADTD